MKTSIHIESWPLAEPFRISGAEWTESRSVIVELEQDGCVGHGEAQGVFYLDETAESLYGQLRQALGSYSGEITRESLQQLLPPGGARNALDCALWDLECKRMGKTIWQLTGIEPGPVTTVFTIGLESTAERMAENAARSAAFPVLKIKLDDQQPLEKLAAIRAARPDARLVVDANQGWTFELLLEVASGSLDLGIDMIEQPLPRGGDEALETFDSPVMLAADESCLHRGEFDAAARRYGMINIKLDKTGGLTEALQLVRLAREHGMGLMVGNMFGTSLSMAPAFVVARLCDFVDLDGPLLLAFDRAHGLDYRRGEVAVFEPTLWG